MKNKDNIDQLKDKLKDQDKYRKEICALLNLGEHTTFANIVTFTEGFVSELDAFRSGKNNVAHLINEISGMLGCAHADKTNINSKITALRKQVIVADKLINTLESNQKTVYEYIGVDELSPLSDVMRAIDNLKRIVEVLNSHPAKRFDTISEVIDLERSKFKYDLEDIKYKLGLEANARHSEIVRAIMELKIEIDRMKKTSEQEQSTVRSIASLLGMDTVIESDMIRMLENMTQTPNNLPIDECNRIKYGITAIRRWLQDTNGNTKIQQILSEHGYYVQGSLVESVKNICSLIKQVQSENAELSRDHAHSYRALGEYEHDCCISLPAAVRSVCRKLDNLERGLNVAETGQGKNTNEETLKDTYTFAVAKDIFGDLTCIKVPDNFPKERMNWLALDLKGIWQNLLCDLGLGIYNVTCEYGFCGVSREVALKYTQYLRLKYED